MLQINRHSFGQLSTLAGLLRHVVQMHFLELLMGVGCCCICSLLIIDRKLSSPTTAGLVQDSTPGFA
jgi:hypothetical protein